MVSIKKILLAVILLINIGIYATQIGVGLHYYSNPVVECEHSKFLTILTLIGGFGGLLSMIFLSFCCYNICRKTPDSPEPSKLQPDEESIVS